MIRKLKGKLSKEYINLREFEEGRTALYIATEMGNELAIKELIDIGADRNLGTVYDEERWDELRDEINESLPTNYEDLSADEQHIYYDYLNSYYNDEINDGNYEIRNYVTEIINLDDEFFDIYITDHIIYGITPSMIACKNKNIELLKILWEDNITGTYKNSNGYNILDYALKSGNSAIEKFVKEKIMPYVFISEPKLKTVLSVRKCVQM